MDKVPHNVLVMPFQKARDEGMQKIENQTYSSFHIQTNGQQTISIRA